MRVKIYVAGNPKEHDLAGIIRRFEAAGHEITFDWTNLPPGMSRTQIAEADLAGVKAADVLVLIDPKQGWGCYVEMGYALGLAKRVLVVAPEYMQIFFHLRQVHVVQTVDTALEVLGG